MIEPDFDFIALVEIYIAGFGESAFDFSTKFIEMIRAIRKRFSRQDHYDFGMRT